MPNFLRTMPISASAASAHLLTGLKREGSGLKESLADCIFCSILAGLGSKGSIALDQIAMDRMLASGAR